MDATVPAGWYADPAARHEQRYWDGRVWTTHVVDHGVASEDALAQEGGVSAVAVSAWRYRLAVGAAVFMFLALMYEALASINAFLLVNGMGPDSFTDELLPILAWMFGRISNPLGVGLFVAYPPVLLWILLPTATVLLERVYVSRSIALRSAGLAAPGLFASGEKKARWSYASSRLQSTGVRLFRRSQRVYLLLGGLASLGVAVVSANAILNRDALILNQGGMPSLTDLELGFGPWVCLTAGAIGLLSAIVIWPWGRQTDVVVHADGAVTLKG